MSYFRFTQVQVIQEVNRLTVYFDASQGFQFSSNKGYIDQIDLWITQALLKGIIKNAYEN